MISDHDRDMEMIGRPLTMYGSDESSSARPASSVQVIEAQWIDPNDKTQKQYLPWIGEACLFAHAGITYYGRHTGGSFQTGQGVTARNFPTWDCVWMPLPKAPNS